MRRRCSKNSDSGFAAIEFDDQSLNAPQAFSAYRFNSETEVHTSDPSDYGLGLNIIFSSNCGQFGIDNFLYDNLPIPEPSTAATLAQMSARRHRDRRRLRPRGLRGRAEFDLDGCRRAEAVQFGHVRVAQRDAVEMPQHGFHSDPPFHASQRRTEAAVDSQAER
jgi:hypothetical protein